MKILHVYSEEVTHHEYKALAKRGRHTFTYFHNNVFTEFIFNLLFQIIHKTISKQVPKANTVFLFFTHLETEQVL